MDFSLWQIAIVLVIALIVFGPKRLPELGRSLGTGMREFKDSITGKNKEEDEEERAQLAPQVSVPQPSADAPAPSSADVGAPTQPAERDATQQKA
jgi:sec-independent protein translocase protein TatA